MRRGPGPTRTSGSAWLDVCQTVLQALVAEGGYKFLDVRSELARTEGPLMSSIHIPLTKAKRRFDSSTRQSVYDYTEISESEWMAQVTKKIPSKDTKLIVVCADGTTNAVRALEALDGAGYKNLVGLRVSGAACLAGPFPGPFPCGRGARPDCDSLASASSAQGGYLRFNQSFDVKGNRRVYTEYKEDYSHSADSAGIHASGAGFAKMDPLIKYDIIIH